MHSKVFCLFVPPPVRLSLSLSLSLPLSLSPPFYLSLRSSACACVVLPFVWGGRWVGWVWEGSGGMYGCVRSGSSQCNILRVCVRVDVYCGAPSRMRMDAIDRTDGWIDGWMPNSSNSISARIGTFTHDRQRRKGANRLTLQKDRPHRERPDQVRRDRHQERGSEMSKASGLAAWPYTCVRHSPPLRRSSIITLYLPIEQTDGGQGDWMDGWMDGWACWSRQPAHRWDWDGWMSE